VGERISEAGEGISRTSQFVGQVRAGMARPHSPDGDPDSQKDLCAGMGDLGTNESPMRSALEARTRYVDARLVEAIAAGVSQIVILGAGYDDRALRFRTPGVRFFEVDHPSTQIDKSRRLDDMRANREGLNLVPADFQSHDLGTALAEAGHDPRSPTMFICEGVLVYLDEVTIMDLLSTARKRSADSSRLVASLAIHPDGMDSVAVGEVANSRRRAGKTEPWLTILPLGEHVELLARAGWHVEEVLTPTEVSTGPTQSHPTNPQPGAVPEERGRSVFVSARANNQGTGESDAPYREHSGGRRRHPT